MGATPHPTQFEFALRGPELFVHVDKGIPFLPRSIIHPFASSQSFFDPRSDAASSQKQKPVTATESPEPQQQQPKKTTGKKGTGK
jgi:hypothetical protein